MSTSLMQHTSYFASTQLAANSEHTSIAIFDRKKRKGRLSSGSIPSSCVRIGRTSFYIYFTRHSIFAQINFIPVLVPRLGDFSRLHRASDTCHLSLWVQIDCDDGRPQVSLHRRGETLSDWPFAFWCSSVQSPNASCQDVVFFTPVHRATVLPFLLQAARSLILCAFVFFCLHTNFWD